MTEIQAGVPLSEEQKAQMRIENERESIEAHNMAKARMEQDIANGVKPVTTTVAEGLLERLKNEDFTPTGTAVENPE